jgi:uncharacterized protein (TIGR02145 family)
MMKQIIVIIIAMLFCCASLHAQGVAINADGSDPNTSAMLDVQSSDKGILIPRLTNTEISTLGAALGASDKGMIVFNSDDAKLEYWNGSEWKTMVTKDSSPGGSSDGTSYCSEGVTDYDGHKYTTVKIGDQCWMAQNLRSNHYADGSAITEAYNYSYDWGNALTYGYLYTWAAVMNGTPSSGSNPSGVQGVCPDGWHLPSDAEWMDLEMTIGMTQAQANATGNRGILNEGRKLKETEDAFLWIDHSNRGSNCNGFTALPGGYRNNGGSFYSIREEARFWTSTESDGINAYYRRLDHDLTTINRANILKSFAMSVRCVKD